MIVSGCPGSNEITMALEKREVEGYRGKKLVQSLNTQARDTVKAILAINSAN
jgi:hypothetical protein